MLAGWRGKDEGKEERKENEEVKVMKARGDKRKRGERENDVRRMEEEEMTVMK